MLDRRCKIDGRLLVSISLLLGGSTEKVGKIVDGCGHVPAKRSLGGCYSSIHGSHKEPTATV